MGYRNHGSTANESAERIPDGFLRVAEIRHTLNMANPELYARARLAGLRVEEVPVRHFPRTGGCSSHDFGKLWRLFWQVVGYFSALFFLCMVCHGELVALKPAPKYLTTFYLTISAGGAAGGLFVGVLAPLMFVSYCSYPPAG